MKRIAWITDIHLNFVDDEGFDRFVGLVAEEEPDAVVITGDIAEAPDVSQWLLRMDEALQRPIHFVLGNHDFYYSTIEGTRQRITEQFQTHPRLCYLTAKDVVPLASNVGLIGHDGWGDARAGDYENSTVSLSDYMLIGELSGISAAERRPRLEQLGDEAAAHIVRVLAEALDHYPEVFLATHVPPLESACWYEGKGPDKLWAPHFVCQAMGDVILRLMARRPDRRLTVLCGHTHNDGVDRPLENVTIYTGGAKYRHPRVERVFEIG